MLKVVVLVIDLTVTFAVFPRGSIRRRPCAGIVAVAIGPSRRWEWSGGVGVGGYYACDWP